MAALGYDPEPRLAPATSSLARVTTESVHPPKSSLPEPDEISGLHAAPP